MKPHRTLLALLALFLLLLTLALCGKYALEMQEGGRFGGDFIGYWQTARELRAGDIPAIYEQEKLEHAPIRALMQNPRAIGRNFAPFVNPPPALPLLWPLSLLTYNEAVALWTALPLILFHLLLCRLYGFRRHPPLLRLVLACSMLPILAANAFSGQAGAWMAVLFLGVLYYLRKPLRAGACLALMACKPQLALLWPLALLAGKQWRILAASAAASLLLAACITAWLGGLIWQEYNQAASLFAQYIAQNTTRTAQLALSPFVSLRVCGLPASSAAIVQCAITLTLACITWKTFRRHAPNRFALLSCAALLATPYAQTYDMPLLAAAVWPLLIRAWERGWQSLYQPAALIAVLLAPLAQAQMAAHIPFGFLALLWFYMLLYKEKTTQEAPCPSPTA